MAINEYTIDKIELPNGDICNIKDTWRGIQDNLTSSSNTTESLSAKQGYLLANGSARDNTKLEKTTYEYNKEITFGGSGKLCIGKFPCYDSNVTIEIKATTSTTYYAVAILATQNINTTSGGTFTWNTYGDSSNTITPNLYAKYASGSNVIEIYFNPTSWSKNLVHIQCSALRGIPTDVCTSVDSIPSDANRQPTNTLLSISTTGNAANVTGIVAIEHGGTGATTIAGARTNLGLGSMATATETNYVKVDGTRAMTGSLSINKAGGCGVEVNNTQSTNPNQVAFIVGSSGNGGIYSRKHSKWIVYSDANGNVVLNGNANTASAFSANKTITLTGDITGSASSTGGWSIATTIGEGKVTNNMLAGSITNGKLSNSKITIADTDVSLGGSITADTLRTSLGLSNAMHFLGVTTTNVSTGTANTTATVTISDSNVTAAAGDVILYNSQEYVWGNSKWNLLGDESSYKVKQTAKSDPTASTTTSTTFIDTISQDANGVITATKKTLPSYVPTSAGVTAVTWDSTNKKLTRTINGSAADVVTIATIKTALGLAKTDVGLSNVTNHAQVTSLQWDTTNKKLTYKVSEGTAANLLTFAAGSNISLTAESGKLTIANTYTAPVSSVAGKTGAVTLAKGDVGLGNVENTALSTWAGTNKITTLGTITTGTWQGTAISASYIGNHSTDKLTSGTLGTGRGGTGINTYTLGDILYSSAANTLSKLSGNTTTTRKFLRSVAVTSGTATAPVWDTLTKTDVGLGNVENTALSTWNGSSNIKYTNYVLKLRKTTDDSSLFGLYFKDPQSDYLGVISYIPLTSSLGNRFEFTSKSSDDNGNILDFTETYRLPNVTKNLNEHVSYNILTTKKTVTIGQGGTGATSAAGARTNLDVYSKDETDAAITQSTALSYDEYSHTNGATIVCMKSGKTVTIRCMGIGSISSIAAGQSFSFNLGANSKYYPPISVFTYGTYAGDWQGSSSFLYCLDSSGNITGYAYREIVNGAFCITFLTT